MDFQSVVVKSPRRHGRIIVSTLLSLAAVMVLGKGRIVECRSNLRSFEIDEYEYVSPAVPKLEILAFMDARVLRSAVGVDAEDAGVPYPRYNPLIDIFRWSRTELNPIYGLEPQAAPKIILYPTDDPVIPSVETPTSQESIDLFGTELNLHDTLKLLEGLNTSTDSSKCEEKFEISTDRMRSLLTHLHKNVMDKEYLLLDLNPVLQCKGRSMVSPEILNILKHIAHVIPKEEQHDVQVTIKVAVFSVESKPLEDQRDTLDFHHVTARRLQAGNYVDAKDKATRYHFALWLSVVLVLVLVGVVYFTHAIASEKDRLLYTKMQSTVRPS